MNEKIEVKKETCLAWKHLNSMQKKQRLLNLIERIINYNDEVNNKLQQIKEFDETFEHIVFLANDITAHTSADLDEIKEIINELWK